MLPVKFVLATPMEQYSHPRAQEYICNKIDPERGHCYKHEGLKYEFAVPWTCKKVEYLDDRKEVWAECTCRNNKLTALSKFSYDRIIACIQDPNSHSACYLENDDGILKLEGNKGTIMKTCKKPVKGRTWGYPVSG